MMFKPMKLHAACAGWRIEAFDACWWIVIGKYVLRIGNPWNRAGYKYAWRPLFQFFKAFK
jgi:hypothetical protein